MIKLLRDIKGSGAIVTFLLPSTNKPVSGKILELNPNLVKIKFKRNSSFYTIAAHPYNITLIHKD